MTDTNRPTVAPGRPGFHGELALILVDAIPEEIASTEPQSRESGRLVVGHSETGHCHVIERPDVQMWNDPNDGLQAWLRVRGAKGVDEAAELKHEKVGKDRHESCWLPPGDYKIRRQREGHSPEVYRQVAD